MRQRTENPTLVAAAATASGHVRVFAGNSSRWKGAVASIIPFENGHVFGSVVALSDEELSRLDVYEGVDSSDPYAPDGVYRRQEILVESDGESMSCVAYVKNNLQWCGPPSVAYLRACKTNIEQFWSEDGGVTITVRKGDGTFVSEWHEPGPTITIKLVLKDLSSKMETEHTTQTTPNQVRAVFAYGTLRADYSKDGDAWGVCEIGGGCKSAYGRVMGYSLHQEEGCFYPFATVADAASVVKGTILSWPSSDSSFQEALERCNQIEGYSPEGGGLYQRSVVNVQVQGGQGIISAYMYHQGQKDISSCKSFPDGDWLGGRGQ